MIDLKALYLINHLIGYMEKEMFQYRLGLGKLNPSSALGRERNNKDAEKLLLMRHETAQETRDKELMKRKTQPLHKRVLYGKTNNEGNIKKLIMRAEEICKEKMSSSQAQREKLAPGTAKEQLRTTFETNQGLIPYDTFRLQDQELLKKRRERWSAAPKSDRRESVREYIQNTRNILLTRITMNEKMEEAKRMEEYIQQKESVLNLNKEIYDQDKNMINKYVEFMKNEAILKKHEVSHKVKMRHDKELELESLIQIKTNLKKTLSENRETCTAYKSYTDFLHSLNPEARSTKNKGQILKRTFNPNRQNRRDFFITGQGHEGELRRRESVIYRDITEMRNELGLTEHDSDTELDPGFTSVEEMLELMNKLIAGNLSLIQNTQKREESLERIHKEYSNKIKEKTMILESIRNDTRELTDEERRKMLRFTELKERMESDILMTNTKLFASEKMKEQIEVVKKLRNNIKELINEIKEIFISNSDKLRARGRDMEPVFNKDTVSTLETISAKILKLKMVRDWKFMTEGSANLLKREMEEKVRHKQEMAEEVLKKNIMLAEKKKEDMLRSWKVPRHQKYGKEIMRKKMLKEKTKKITSTKVQKVDDEFDDKYFVD